MIREAIEKSVSGKSLSEEEMTEAIEEIMDGGATQAQIGAFLVALRMKGESIEEITAAAKVMRSKSYAIPHEWGVDDRLVDTCGTGGDCANSFNISTTAAFVVAGAGVRVAKHGNRSVSSKCGSADVMEALGMPLDLTPAQAARCMREVGIGFLFAPVFHPAMKHVIGPRRELGIRSMFNLLGPLTNPAHASAQVLGVYDAALVMPMTHVVARLGIRRAFIVHGHGGLDEISLSGPTSIGFVDNGRVSFQRVCPEDFNVKPWRLNPISGGGPRENAALTLSVLNGEKGPYRDIVLMNAAATLVAAGVTSSFADGMALSRQSIDSGSAANKLKQLISLAQLLKGRRI